MITRAMQRRSATAVLGAGLVAVLALPLLASSPAAAHCGLSHYRSKPKEIVVVGSTGSRRSITDVTMKRGVVGAGNHPDMLWLPARVSGR